MREMSKKGIVNDVIHDYEIENLLPPNSDT